MKIVFMGTPPAAAVSLERLIGDGHEVAAVYTQPDRPAGRGNKIVFSAVKESALKHGLSLQQPAKVRTPDAAETFRSHAADVAVVVAFGRILPLEFLNAFPLGAINLHFSLLPRYRGAAPVNWAIVNGETSTGVTTIRMDEGLDTGHILLSRETHLGIEETAPELMSRLAELGAEVLAETLERLNEITPTPQDEGLATFAPILKREDGNIEWRREASDIVNMIRGFQPFPGTYSYLHGKKMNIWSAAAEREKSMAGSPGEVLSTSSGELAVAAGEGSILRVTEIQLEGKRRMAVRDALNGTRITPGDRFAREPHQTGS